jgi:putative phosphoesterase
MRILVISDTHLSSAGEPFAAMVERYAKETDLIVHAGDYTSPEVVDFLNGYPFAGVAGNMDPADVHRRLPMKRVVSAGDYRIGLIHGFGSSVGLLERVAAEFESVDAVIFGHSHQPLVTEKRGVLIFNPGSPFSPRHRGGGTVGILTANAGLAAEIVEVEG